MNLSGLKLFTILSALIIFSPASFAETSTEGELPPRYPSEYSENHNRSGSGCYVTFFDKKDFRGRSTTLYGNKNFRHINLKRAFGFEPDSLIVGNRANIWLYDGDNYDDLDYYFRAGSGMRKVSNLDSIDSLEMRCI